MEFKDPTKKMTCPFDPNHIILEHRMPKHIIQCQKNFPNSELRVCPLNAIHVVHKKDFDVHLEHCPSKDLIYRDQYVVAEDDGTDREKERNALAKEADQLLASTSTNDDMDWDTPAQSSYLDQLPERLESQNVLLQGEVNQSKNASKLKWKNEKCRLVKLD